MKVPRYFDPLALVIASLLLVATVLPIRCAAQGTDQRSTELFNGKEVVSNEVLMQFRAALAEKRGEMTSDEKIQSENLSIAEIEESFQTEHLSKLGGAGWYLVRSRGIGTDALVRGIGARTDVAFVEPNYLIKPALNSIAQYYAPYQWALNNTGQTISGPSGVNTGTPGADIKASQSWDLTTGFRTSVIATIDPTGIDYTHPDLSPNIWSAPSSYNVVVLGVNYTCPIGSHGFQFVNNAQTEGPCDPLELFGQSHGTILAGIMGANGASSIGVSGINWSTSIIHVIALGDADVIAAIDFLVQTKQHFGALANIRVINNSYLLADNSQAVLQEILVANSNDMLFVAAAGNGGNNNDPPGGTYPASFGAPPYNAPNVISVANTDNNDNLCEAQCAGVASAWGSQSVHLGAPGWAIASTMRGGGYNVAMLYNAEVSTGTSASAPYVTGSAALVLSRCADLNTAQLKQDLLDNVDYVTGLYGCYNLSGLQTYCTITRGMTPSGQPGGGRLNAYKAVSACGYALSVTKNGAGSGTVTSSSSGTVSGSLTPINCGSACSAVFKSNVYGGSSVTLTATPAAGSLFTGWTGACSGTGTCTVTVSAARSVQATFTQSFTLTVTKAGTGSGTVTSSPAGISCGATCAAGFQSGTVVTLTASASAGSVFSGWGGACSGTGTCTVTMSAATAVTATFLLLPDFLLSASPGSQTVVPGFSTTYTATLSPIAGFTGTVVLSATGLPTGASGTFSPNPVNGASGNSTLTVTTVSSISVGTYPLTIKGTSGSLTHSVTVSLIIAVKAGPLMAGAGASVGSALYSTWLYPNDVSSSTLFSLNSTGPGQGNNTTQALQATNFGFALSTTTPIAGISVSFNEFYDTFGGTPNGSMSVQLLKGGTAVGTVKTFMPTLQPNSSGPPTVATLGGSTDLWGGSCLYSDVNASNFGVAITFTDPTNHAGDNVKVNNVQVTVYF
jgi:Subtilase family/Divergent InlB B-repeat domain